MITAKSEIALNAKNSKYGIVRIILENRPGQQEALFPTTSEYISGAERVNNTIELLFNFSKQRRTWNYVRVFEILPSNSPEPQFSTKVAFFRKNTIYEIN